MMVMALLMTMRTMMETVWPMKVKLKWRLVLRTWFSKLIILTEDEDDDGDGILDGDEDDDGDGLENDEDPDDDGDGIMDEDDEL